MRRKISPEIQLQVCARANYLCEYCHTSEQWQYVRFTLDHVIPSARGGSDDFTNLALACFHCNRRKSNRVTGADPDSGKEMPLFNPRQDAWRDHFVWSSDGLSIVGLTSIGRATVIALDLNRERVMNIRAADQSAGRHPPFGDPVQSIQS
ncbi:MAG: HNH endonuclease [Chloroflexi bacterium UTCFX4]|nr:MAG: HNH endonuclease [Chloroflexi bacterium UTCFX4]